MKVKNRESTQDRPINTRLRMARKRNMWTLSEVADMIGVSPQTYQRWERGTQDPHLSSLRKLCELFKKEPDGLGFAHLTSSEEE